VKVYAGDPERYQTFITPEAYNAVKAYIEYREASGEKIGPNTPILRDLFHPDRGGQGEPHLPKRLATNGVKRIIEDALKGTGLRTPITKEEKARGKHRHEFQGAHGFRKFFKSAAERRMKSLHVEILLGHDTGLNESYYRPSEEDLLSDYLRALPDLTILEKPQAAPTEDVESLKARVSFLEKTLREVLPLLEGMKKERQKEKRGIRTSA
jgi:hypothetical protein